MEGLAEAVAGVQIEYLGRCAQELCDVFKNAETDFTDNMVVEMTYNHMRFFQPTSWGKEILKVTCRDDQNKRFYREYYGALSRSKTFACAAFASSICGCSLPTYDDMVKLADERDSEELRDWKA
jgi:hypothetical protein